MDAGRPYMAVAHDWSVATLAPPVVWKHADLTSLNFPSRQWVEPWCVL